MLRIAKIAGNINVKLLRFHRGEATPLIKANQRDRRVPYQFSRRRL